MGIQGQPSAGKNPYRFRCSINTIAHSPLETSWERCMTSSHRKGQVHRSIQSCSRSATNTVARGLHLPINKHGFGDNLQRHYGRGFLEGKLARGMAVQRKSHLELWSTRFCCFDERTQMTKLKLSRRHAYTTDDLSYRVCRVRVKNDVRQRDFTARNSCKSIYGLPPQPPPVLPTNNPVFPIIVYIETIIAPIQNVVVSKSFISSTGQKYHLTELPCRSKLFVSPKSLNVKW